MYMLFSWIMWQYIFLCCFIIILNKTKLIYTELPSMHNFCSPLKYFLLTDLRSLLAFPKIVSTSKESMFLLPIFCTKRNFLFIPDLSQQMFVNVSFHSNTVVNITILMNIPLILYKCLICRFIQQIFKDSILLIGIIYYKSLQLILYNIIY